MTLAVGDQVRMTDNHDLEGMGLAIGERSHVTVVHGDGTIEIEGRAGRFMATRFERVDLVT